MVRRYKKSGEEIEVLSSPIDITIYTKVPSKYILIDTEYDQIYIGNRNGYWEKLDNMSNLTDYLYPENDNHSH